MLYANMCLLRPFTPQVAKIISENECLWQCRPLWAKKSKTNKTWKQTKKIVGKQTILTPRRLLAHSVGRKSIFRPFFPDFRTKARKQPVAGQRDLKTEESALIPFAWPLLPAAKASRKKVLGPGKWGKMAQKRENRPKMAQKCDF